MEVSQEMRENLDLACAKTAQEIALDITKDGKQLHRLLTQALGVLEEQGLYALFLFLKTKDKLGVSVADRLEKFLHQTPRQEPLFSESENCFAQIQRLAEDLDRLLLARDLLRQVLLYASYHSRVGEDR
jgi:hypothetical protein